MKRIIILLLTLFLLPSSLLFSSDNSISSDIIEKELYVPYKKYDIPKEELLNKDFDSLYLMIASPSTQSIGSFSGHTFLVLTKGNTFENSYAINYFAYHEKYSTPIKTLIGSTIGLEGYLDIRPFSEIAERYNIGQNRTIFYYQIKTDKTKIKNIINKSYEIKDEKLRYQFFFENCANVSQEILLSSYEGEFKAHNNLIPAYLAALLEKDNLVTENGTISPIESKIKKEDIGITEKDFYLRKTFNKIYERETTTSDNFSTFIPLKDKVDYGTIIDSNVSNLLAGYSDNSFQLGFSLFENLKNEQRQSNLENYQVRILSFNVLINNSLKLKNLTVFQFNTYPKINKEEFKLSKSLDIGIKNDDNSSLYPYIQSGYGFTFGNDFAQLNILAQLKLPLNKLGINVNLDASLSFFNKFGYMMIELNYPIYEHNLVDEKILKITGSFTLMNAFNLETSYDFYNSNLSILFRYKFYPFFI